MNDITIGGSNLSDNIFINKSLGTIRVRDSINIQYIVRNILFFSCNIDCDVDTT